MTINLALFYLVAADAGVILVMGLVAAGLILFNKDAKIFWDRVVPATIMLVLTSFAAGVVLWIGHYLFVLA